MAEQSQSKSWQPSMNLYCAFFVLMFLLALPELYTAEIAAKSHGWHLKFVIVLPWMLGLLAGIIPYLAPKRKQRDTKTAGFTLFLLAFLISASYEAIDGLSRLVHWREAYKGLKPVAFY